MKNQVTEARQDIRDKTEIFRREEKAMKHEHQQMVEMEDKCRKLTQLLKYYNTNKGVEEPVKAPQRYDREEIVKLKKEIQSLEVSKKEEEKEFKRQGKKQEQEKSDLQRDLDILALKLKEKRHESRLNDLKIKELRRQIPDGHQIQLKSEKPQLHKMITE